MLRRTGIALASDLLKRFDRSIGKPGYTSRSKAFRDLLVTEWTAVPESTVADKVTLIHDHHARGVTEKLAEFQHENHQLVVSTSHAHLDHDSYLEMLIEHGKSAAVEQFANLLTGRSGVKHGRDAMTILAHAIEPLHDSGRKPNYKQIQKH